MELTRETILLLLPLIILQFGLAVYCIVKIFTEGVRSFNRWTWVVICLFLNIFGPLIFLLWGRKRAD